MFNRARKYILPAVACSLLFTISGFTLLAQEDAGQDLELAYKILEERGEIILEILDISI